MGFNLEQQTFELGDVRCLSNQNGAQSTNIDILAHTHRKKKGGLQIIQPTSIEIQRTQKGSAHWHRKNC